MVKESKVMSFIVKIGVVVSQFLSCLNILIWDEVLSLVFPSCVCVCLCLSLCSAHRSLVMVFSPTSHSLSGKTSHLSLCMDLEFVKGSLLWALNSV